MPDPSTPTEVAAVLARFAELAADATDEVDVCNLIATIKREYRERAECEAAEELAKAWNARWREGWSRPGRPYARGWQAEADRNFARARRLLGIEDGDT